MTEVEAIRKSSDPVTMSSLVEDLRALGVEPGITLIVHTSLSSMGWVAGGSQALVMALIEVLTDTGTLVMPAHSGGNSDPAHWSNPPVPYHWHEPIRQNMPAFDPRCTPTRGLGEVPELFRTWPGVIRSNHPNASFSAWGRYARAVTMDHRLDSSFGEDSPLARIYDFDGRVLLIGVEHDVNTSLHLSEYRADWPGRAIVKHGAAIMVGDARQWVSYSSLYTDSSDFGEIGWDFVKSGQVKTGKLGKAKSQLMSQRALVDFGVEWMNRGRHAYRSG